VGPIVQRRGSDLPHEPIHAAGVLAGRRGGWLKPGEPLDYFDLKGVVENLLRGFGIGDVAYVPPAGAPFFHPGVSAEIRGGGVVLGALGELEPVIARRLRLEQRAFYFEVALEPLQRGRGEVHSAPPPRFPAVTRDVSFWIGAEVLAAEQRAAFASAAEPLLRSVAVLEDFRDPRYVAEGKKGMLWTMTYRSDERTLTDAEADVAHARVVKGLSDRHSIQIR
jgi:phenylalanyl-tRNA synthetase beta chain